MKGGRVLRVIGGSLQGRRIQVPSGLDVRPMRGRIREALFGILGEQIRGARVLDVFSGSGAIAIEALSRGALEAVLVEKDPKVASVLEDNLRELGLTARARLLKRDVYQQAVPESEQYRFVFLDPPFPHYRDPLHDPWKLAQRLSEHLELNGAVILEFPRWIQPPEPEPPLELATRKRYGDTQLVVWEKTSCSGQ